MTSARRCTAFLFATTATLLLATAAAADLVPLLDLRQLHGKAVYEGAPQEFTAFPFADFGAWNWYEVAQADGAEAGHASATAFQISQLSRDGIGNPTGFFHSGGTSGEFQVGVGSYEALSLSTMVFRLTTTSDFFLDATLDLGNAGSQGDIVLGDPNGAPHVFTCPSPPARCRLKPRRRRPARSLFNGARIEFRSRTAATTAE